MNTNSFKGFKSIGGNRVFMVSAISLQLAVLALTLFWVAGCGHKTSTLSEKDLKAFDSAPAEVKQTWDKALAADKANDYLTTQNLLDSLGKMQLTAEQNNALQSEIGSFSLRLWQAAEKNDPAATKAVQEINQSKGRRGVNTGG